MPPANSGTGAISADSQSFFRNQNNKRAELRGLCAWKQCYDRSPEKSIGLRKRLENLLDFSLRMNETYCKMVTFPTRNIILINSSGMIMAWVLSNVLETASMAAPTKVDQFLELL